MQKKQYHQKFRQEATPLTRTTTLEQQVVQKSSLYAMQRKIQILERTIAQREHELWTLKQLLLYR